MPTTVSAVPGSSVRSTQPARPSTGGGIFLPPAPGRSYDMELGAQPEAVVRHHLENCLALFCAVLDGGEEDGFLDLVRTTAISLNGSLSTGTPVDLRDLYRVLVPSPHIRSVHVFHNLQVRIEGNEALYTAIFQRWTAGSRPICLDIGYFSGCMTAGPQVWYWTRHSITSAATGRRDGV